MAKHIIIKIDPEKKEEFSEVCANMGFTVTSAVNVFINKVLQSRRMPFDITANGEPLDSEENQKKLST